MIHTLSKKGNSTCHCSISWSLLYVFTVFIFSFSALPGHFRRLLFHSSKRYNGVSGDYEQSDCVTDCLFRITRLGMHAHMYILLRAFSLLPTWYCLKVSFVGFKLVGMARLELTFFVLPKHAPGQIRLHPDGLVPPSVVTPAGKERLSGDDRINSIGSQLCT